MTRRSTAQREALKTLHVLTRNSRSANKENSHDIPAAVSNSITANSAIRTTRQSLLLDLEVSNRRMADELEKLQDLVERTQNEALTEQICSQNLRLDNKQKDLTIQKLESRITELEEDCTHLREDFAYNYSNTRKNTSRLQKRCRRLEAQKARNQKDTKATLRELRKSLAQKESQCLSITASSQELSVHNVFLQKQVKGLSGQLQEQLASLAELQNRLQQQQERDRLISSLRKSKHQSDMQARRAKQSLLDVRYKLRSISTWSSLESGAYTTEARRLARFICQAGCAEDKVAAVIAECGKAFGVEVLGCISRRTVKRAKDEAGFLGLVQLGREIDQAPGKPLFYTISDICSTGIAFGESSDGTTHRRITKEARSLTVLAPSYEPGVDDSNQATWKHQSRFAEVASALDHTAQRQFEGTKFLAKKVATAYAGSPLAMRDGSTFEADDWIRKQVSQNMDHAADAKKKFKLCVKWKEDVTRRDLGQQVIDSMSTGDLLAAILAITEDDINNYAGKGLYSEDEKRDLAMKVLQRQLGDIELEKLPPAKKGLVNLLVLGGCCGHKDLNAFKYGVVDMGVTWGTNQIEGPVLLANKANDSVIRLGQDADSAAVQKAIESSARGGVKLASLAGALFNNKFEGKGYQDLHTMFMSKWKKDLHGQATSVKFPDTSNTQYQSHSYAAAELVTHLELYLELIAEVCDSKHKPGLNHVEQNILKGLQCSKTITELAAMALYGVSVSWPYLRMVRGTSGELINLLDLMELHRRIPGFCDRIAGDPLCLLRPDTPLDVLTLDGLPLMDPMLISAVAQLAPDLRYLGIMISSMFGGAGHGWRIFTPEFQPGGTFDSLTAEERKLIFIPSTNDANEGALGAFRVYIRYHPHATVSTFSNKARVRYNNTENFILKHCSHDDQLYARREVRKQDSSGENAKFHTDYLAAQHQRAKDERDRQEVKTQQQRKEIERLVAIGLVADRSHILNLNIKQLDDQLKIYCKILHDAILLLVKKKFIRLKTHKQSAVLAALTRNEDIIRALQDSQTNLPLPNPVDINEDIEHMNTDIDSEDELD